MSSSDGESIFEMIKNSGWTNTWGRVAATDDIKSTNDKIALMDAFASANAKNYIINDAPLYM
jgi:hypothetical protein